MSLLLEEMRRSYRAQRGVSQGAAITLVSRSWGYTASFECATRCSQVLGTRGFLDDGQSGKNLAYFQIPTEDLHRAITKLSEAFSVALVDTVSDENGTRFVLVWKILSRPESFALFASDTSPALTDPSQGTLDLDEY